MGSLKIEVLLPSDILLALNKNKKEFSKDIQQMIAFDLYSNGKISLGKAAEICGLSKTVFIELMSSKGISLFNWDEEELSNELDSVKQLAKEISK